MRQYRTRLSSLLGTSASNSSKKMTHGEEARARAKTCLTARSLSPTYWDHHHEYGDTLKKNRGLATLFNNSGPFTLMKFALDSFATAFANSVFPHPGGPQSNTPHGDEIPNLENNSGLSIGCTIAMCNSSRVPCNAPTSDHVTSGTVANPSRLDEGCTCFNARWKSAEEMKIGSSWASVRGFG